MKNKNKDKNSLNDVRQKINGLDETLIKLLNERALLAKEIGDIKKESSTEIFNAAREEQVYKRIADLTDGPLDAKALRSIYREIMSATKNLEKSLGIAFLGPQATYTHQAALSKFGSSVNYVPAENIRDVFFKVEKDNADYGVVPVENTTEGVVSYTMDMLVESDLKICSEVLLNISHNIMGVGSLSDIKRIYSKDQVFSQCRRWLTENMPKVELIEVASTAAAADMAKDDKTAAVIGSKTMSSIYGLNILKEAIEDSSYNVTRFLVLGKSYSDQTGKDKTSVVFLTHNNVGALHDVLGIFKNKNINLTKIESRPSRRQAWEYYIFVDFFGHYNDESVIAALEELRGQCSFVKVLGSYPIASL